MIKDEVAQNSFQKVLNFAKRCAKQNSFPHQSDEDLDCDYCPGRQKCIYFWDQYVVNLPVNMKEKVKYLRTVPERLLKFKFGKSN
jgi:hypothetical protein